MAYPRIRVAMFAYGGIHPRTQRSLLGEMSYAAQRGIEIEYRGIDSGAMIDKSRSAALTEWYRTDTHGVLFMIDHDMEWRPGDVCETARLAAESRGVVGCLYAKKGIGQGLTSSDGKAGRKLAVGTPEHATAPCRYVATGLLAIDRSVPGRMWSGLGLESDPYREAVAAALAEGDLDRLETLIPLGITESHQTEGGDPLSTIIDFFRPLRIRSEQGEWLWLGEDYSFSERCRHCGIETLLNTRPTPLHWGDFGFSLRQATARREGDD